MNMLIRLRRDDGAVAVVVALLMVVLIGFAAISIDVGANYAERRQLQNGADAAALAVALDSGCRGTATAANTVAAVDLAQHNVNDGLAQASTAIDPVASTVTATAWVVDGTGAPGRHNWFAPVLGFDTTQIKASTTATCGQPLGGTAALPLTFPLCQFGYTATPKLIRYDQNAPNCTGGTGTAIPGGFGWLAETGGGCGATISADIAQTPGQPGNSFPGNCSGMLAQLPYATIMIPVYDYAGGNGRNGWFHVVGFAAFTITGYKFGGNVGWNSNAAGQPSCTGNCRGIIGTFVKRVSLDAGYTMGGSDFGVTNVRLSR